MALAQSSETSMLPRLFSARGNGRRPLLGKLRPEVWATVGSWGVGVQVHIASQFYACVVSRHPFWPQGLALAKDLGYSGGAPRCERDTGVRDPGVPGTQVAWRTQLNGLKKVANTAQGLRLLQRDLGPRSSGEAGWRGLPGPARSGNTRPARPRSGGGGGASKEAGPGGP